MGILRMEQKSKMFDLSLSLKKKEGPLVVTGIDRAEYDNLIRYFMKKSSIKLKDKASHESRLNNTMSTSSRSTRTRKNIKPSTLSNDALANQMNIGMNDEDDAEDEDYNMNEDKNYLQEDDENDDEQYEKITTRMDIERGTSESSDDEKSERRSKKKKKKKKKSKDEDDDMMVESDQDE